MAHSPEHQAAEQPSALASALARAFSPAGARAAQRGGELASWPAELTVHKLGTVGVSEGSAGIVVSDPWCLPSPLYQLGPFAASLPAGRYPVVVCVAAVPEQVGTASPGGQGREERVALAQLRLAGEAPIGGAVRCTELGLLAVDAGTAAFGSAEAVAALAARFAGADGQEEQPQGVNEPAEPSAAAATGGPADRQVAGSAYRTRLIQESLDARRRSGRPWAGLDAYPDAEAPTRNVLGCASGWGDGEYPLYAGTDAAGALVCLVLDFRLLTLPPAAEHADEEHQTAIDARWPADRA
jgi:hypothetical protein